jgi:hypothetical protein
MDSRTVNSQIKKRIWPLLRDAGFEVFASRTAWRHGCLLPQEYECHSGANSREASNNRN